MIALFKSVDPMEIKRLGKANDMACFIFELSHNMERKFRDSEVDHSEVFEEINRLLAEFSIDINDLID